MKVTESGTFQKGGDVVHERTCVLYVPGSRFYASVHGRKGGKKKGGREGGQEVERESRPREETPRKAWNLQTLFSPRAKVTLRKIQIRIIQNAGSWARN